MHIFKPSIFVSVVVVSESLRGFPYARTNESCNVLGTETNKSCKTDIENFRFDVASITDDGRFPEAVTKTILF